MRAILPNSRWLRQNGYRSLDYAVRKNPNLNWPPLRSLKGKSPQEWVSVAQKLAKKNGGFIPNYSYLQQNGYGGLDHAIRRNPNLNWPSQEFKITKIS